MSREILQCSALQILAAAIARTYRLSQTNSLLWRNGLECTRNSHFHQMLTLSSPVLPSLPGSYDKFQTWVVGKRLYFLYWKQKFSTSFLRRCPKSEIYKGGFLFITINEKFSMESEQHIPEKSMSGARRGWSWKTTFAHRCPDNFSNHYSKPIPTLPSDNSYAVKVSKTRPGLVILQILFESKDHCLNVEVHSHMMHSLNIWLSHKPHQWAIMRRFLATRWIFHLMWITALRNLLFSQNFKNLYQNCLKIRLTVYNERIIKTYIEIINI